MTDLATLRAQNAARWKAAKLTRQAEYTLPVKRALAAKDRYLQIANRTGVHWSFIAVTHYRESSQDFSKSLAQGDPWDRVSVHEPRGRGPFKSFEDAAVDALVNCAPHASQVKDWSMPNMLTTAEAFNGLKYFFNNVPSPYIWSGTDQYKIGKVLKDHGPIEPVVDKQLGVAGFLICLQNADPTLFKSFPPPTIHTDPVIAKGPVLTPDKPQETFLQEVWDWLKTH